MTFAAIGALRVIAIFILMTTDAPIRSCTLGTFRHVTVV